MAPAVASSAVSATAKAGVFAEYIAKSISGTVLHVTTFGAANGGDDDDSTNSSVDSAAGSSLNGNASTTASAPLVAVNRFGCVVVNERLWYGLRVLEWDFAAKAVRKIVHSWHTSRPGAAAVTAAIATHRQRWVDADTAVAAATAAAAPKAKPPARIDAGAGTGAGAELKVAERAVAAFSATETAAEQAAPALSKIGADDDDDDDEVLPLLPLSPVAVPQVSVSEVPLLTPAHVSVVKQTALDVAASVAAALSVPRSNKAPNTLPLPSSPPAQVLAPVPAPPAAAPAPAPAPAAAPIDPAGGVAVGAVAAAEAVPRFSHWVGARWADLKRGDHFRVQGSARVYYHHGIVRDDGAQHLIEFYANTPDERQHLPWYSRIARCLAITPGKAVVMDHPRPSYYTDDTPVWRAVYDNPPPADAVIARALALVHSADYHFATRNCECMAQDVVTGVVRSTSKQTVDALRSAGWSLAHSSATGALLLAAGQFTPEVITSLDRVFIQGVGWVSKSASLGMGGALQSLSAWGGPVLAFVLESALFLRKWYRLRTRKADGKLTPKQYRRLWIEAAFKALGKLAGSILGWAIGAIVSAFASPLGGLFVGFVMGVVLRIGFGVAFECLGRKLADRLEPLTAADVEAADAVVADA